MLYIGETGRYLRTRFGEHRRATIGNDANQPVARHSGSGNHSVSDMKIRAHCPISGSNDSRKKHEMCLISELSTVPYGINGLFPIFNSICLCLSKADIYSTLNSYLIPYLFRIFFVFVVLCIFVLI